VRAAIYARISRDDLGDGLGVARQQEDCQAVCKRRKWTLAGTFVDNDTSAFSGRTRPAYKRLLSEIAAGNVDVVVSWAPERLHRSPRELEDFLELIEAAGVGVETVKAGTWDVSTSHGRLVARMLGAVSRAESERTGERVSRAHQQAKERGLWRGPIPFGLKASSKPGQPEPDPSQAEIVRNIFARVLRGDSLTRIAHELNVAGARPRRGLTWTHTGIVRLMQSPALGGLVAVDGDFKPAAFAGVVSADEWRAARAALHRRPRAETRRPRETLTLLGGFLVCAEHGHVCFGRKATHAPIYSAAQPGHCNVSVVRSAADELLTEVVVERFSRPDAAGLFQLERDQSDVESQINDLFERREEIADLVAEGLLSASTARPRLAGILDRLAALESQRAPRAFDPQVFVDPAAVWGAWSVTQKREVLRLLFARVAIRHVGQRNGPRADPSRFVLDWRHAA
jgi:site-specific DNA recombinase